MCLQLPDLRTIGGFPALLLASLLAIHPSFAHAEVPSGAPQRAAVALEARFAAIPRLHASFVQRQFDATGRLLEESRGELVAERPDRFRWRTDAPVPSVLVSDGTTLWVHDVDLAQVVIRTLDAELANAPVRILSGNAATLADAYRIEQPAPDEFVLAPRADGAQFDQLRIGFEVVAGRPQLRTLSITDALGQVSRVRFDTNRPTTQLDPGTFSFEIPEGVDVVDARITTAADSTSARATPP